MYENIESTQLDRSMTKIEENEYVLHKNRIYKISSIIDFKEVVGIDIETKRAKRLSIADLKPVSAETLNSERNHVILKDIAEFTDDEFKEIEKKYKAILPILSNNITRAEVEEYAKKIGVHYTTLYRWLRKYKTTGTLASLLPEVSGRKKGETRLDMRVERLMQSVIEKYYLTHQRPSVQSVITKVFIECKKQNLKAPSKNTIRNRIHALSEYDVLKKQGNRALARTKYEPTPHKFKAEYPMQIVQIDHTNVDLILVDDESREPIGRPYITIATDIYSRMIVGYYLSLNPPSSVSVAMCITNMAIPKDKLLNRFEIDAQWNVWGFPETIHVDNGADFRAKALKSAGLLHGINIEFRPINKTHYGGHIERAIGTLMSSVHEIPGTTFSSIHQRKEYDSDKHASMTFAEFEKWLVTYITKIYHERKHEGIGMPPKRLWDIGIFEGEAPIGLLPKPADPLSITLDFLPVYERTIQTNGITIEGLNYYSHLLRAKIHAKDDVTGKKKKFIFKRDPRNIKYIWFYDEELQKYFKIPVADQAMPDMTLWEFNLIKKRLHEKNIHQVDMAQILNAHEELHKQIEESVNKSKKARRAKQRLKNQSKEVNMTTSTTTIKHSRPIVPATDVDESIWDGDIPVWDEE